MRLTEILLESEQVELTEGPLLNKIGTKIGKAVGTVGKAAGAVAGLPPVAATQSRSAGKRAGS